MVANIQCMGSMRPMGGMHAPKPLTDEQKKTVQDILSNYDANSLSATDAKSIFKSLEEAGIRGGGGLRDVIQTAGFNADTVWSLAHDGQKPPPPPPQGGMNGMGGQQSPNSINTSTLQTLQSILSQFDLSNLSSDKQKDLLTQLTDSGLLKTGSMIDLSA